VRLQALGRQRLRRSGGYGEELANPFGALRLAQSILSAIDCLSTRRSVVKTIYGRESLVEPRNVIVTGASHGIGEYIARALAARRMNLLLVARSEPELARLAEELRSKDTTVAFAAIDLAGPRAAAQVAAAAAAELGGVDVLVNNAALELQRRFHTLGAEEIERVIRVDLITPIELTHLLLPGMLERGYGRIVNISSIAGHVGFRTRRRTRRARTASSPSAASCGTTTAVRASPPRRSSSARSRTPASASAPSTSSA
jgi:NAD(P)-dependent dehydrogenase (short-subunit alcohol dehydrogenase family)